MSCENCGSCGTASAPSGCGDKGHCSSGSCNKLNTFDWLSHIDLPEQANVDIIEVGFKQNARKEFFRKPHYLYVNTGDYVVVESAAGSYDIGRVSLVGELVRMQMKKKRVRDNAILPNVLRLANERDIERLAEARALEKDTLVKARAIARSLNLDMKVGDVEFQGDKRKVTFYYTADGRIDFRELIRIYAKEFKVKIEMRQIGARQESARIGGIGACGRELCCSTWLSDFKSVSTVAARYQNLAINQSKLSGQCGRLKCCLNYELKSYLDALRDFPKNVDKLETQRGTVILIKTDIFKRLMYYGYQQPYGVADIQALSTEQVRQFAEWNAQGIKPQDLAALQPNEAGEIQMPVALDASAANKQQRVSRLHRKIDKNDSNIEEDEPLELPDIQEKSKRRKNKKRKPAKGEQAALGEEKAPNAKNTPSADFKPAVSEKPVVAHNPTKEQRGNNPKNQPKHKGQNPHKAAENKAKSAPNPEQNAAMPAQEKVAPNQQPAADKAEKGGNKPIQEKQLPNKQQPLPKKPNHPNQKKQNANPQQGNAQQSANNPPQVQMPPAQNANAAHPNPNPNQNPNQKSNKSRFHHNRKGKSNQNKPNEKNNQPPKQ